MTDSNEVKDVLRFPVGVRPQLVNRNAVQIRILSKAFPNEPRSHAVSIRI